MMASSTLYPSYVRSSQGSTSPMSLWQKLYVNYKPKPRSSIYDNITSAVSIQKGEENHISKLQQTKPQKTAAFPVLSSHWCPNKPSSVDKITEDSMHHPQGYLSRKSDIIVPGGSDSAPIKMLPRTAHCCVCKETVEETNFKDHLFFGPVKCSECNISCSNCSSFKSVPAVGSCHHIFKFADPYEFLLSQNSKFFFFHHGKSESEPSGKSTIENYIKVLKNSCLYDRIPWRRAIQAVKKKHKKNILNNSSATYTHEKSRQSKTNNNIVSSETTPNGMHTEVVDEHILSQTYDLETLDKATEYRYVELTTKAKRKIVRVQPFQQSKYGDKAADANRSVELPEINANRSALLPEIAASQKSESPKKILDKRRESDSPSNELQSFQEPESSRKVMTKRKRNDSDSLINMPKDGYYLVMTKAIEECPMCYTVICPSRFLINVVSYLVTTVCIGCGLTIYFTVSPNVSIVTDNATISINRSGRSLKRNGKKKSKTVAEAVKAKDFFA